MGKKFLSFPKGFLWGTASSAHQVEGNNIHSDWWHWETTKKPGQKWPLEPSGIACDFYHRYEEDFDLCQKMHNNAVRLSIEWARLEPEPGKFDRAEFAHYRKVLKAAKKRGLKTFVTLNHFTNPQWFSKRGGWTQWDAPQIFARYTKECVQELDKDIDAFITINEPDGNALQGYVTGKRYPGKKLNLVGALTAIANYHRAHNAAARVIKSLTNTPVGIVKNIGWFEARPGKSCFWDRWLARFCLWLTCDYLIGKIHKNLDFLGYNHYFTIQFSYGLPSFPAGPRNDMNWVLYPPGLGRMLAYLHKFTLPLYVTEHGLPDGNDTWRKEYIHNSLIGVHEALAQGADVRGYFHWTLTDNFEWNDGYDPKFGLVAIDRKKNLKRTPRPSFFYYAGVCQKNGVERAILEA